MGMTNAVSNIRDRFDSETGLLLLFVIVSSYMLLVAHVIEGWGHNSRIFVDLSAGGLLFGSLLLLFREYLPGPLYSFVAEEAAMFERESEEFQQEMDMDTEEPGEIKLDRPIGPVMSAALLFTLYAAVGYLISLLVATPLFVIAYMRWFRQGWVMTGFLAFVSLVIAYVFAAYIRIPVDRGILVGDLLHVIEDALIVVI